MKPNDIAIKALDKIESLGLQPVPQVYELWYRYFQGDPELVQAIDQHQGSLDEVTCHKIYKRYLSETAKDDMVRRIGEDIESSIAEIADLFNTVQTATTDYGGNLEGATQRIQKAKTLQDLTQVVSSIVADTRKMVEKNHMLENQLTATSKQVSDLRHSLDSIKKEAMTDGLTGLSNRKAFDKYIRDCIEESESTGSALVLMMLDIDYFKKFNDTYGHLVGDQVLRLVARALTDGVKGRDIAARYGGEEFVIILPDTPLQSGMKVAEALRKSVESKEVINRSNNENLGRITLSIGVAEYKPAESVSEFIERADTALYEAKKTGRNRVVFSSL